MEPARVIVLNGPSVAGKSTVQKKLQELFDEPYLAMGLDSMFCGMMPQRFFTGSPPPANHREVCWGDAFTDESGAPVFKLCFGPRGRRVMAGMHEAVGAFGRSGCSAIVDVIFYEADFAAELARTLDGVNAYLVGMRVPLAVLEAREKARATSPVGHARSHFHTVHAHGVYDLEIDASKDSPEACASEIAAHVRAHLPHTFETLRRRA